ncbi:MAG: hypothetical protein ACOC7S_00820 [Planctomycetota bacterium]
MAGAGISNDDLADLLATTRRRLPPGRFYHTQELQRYEVVDRWFQQDREVVHAGTGITEDIVLTETGNAEHVRLYQRRNVNIGDVMSQIKTGWCQADTHYALERREMLRNRSPEGFVSLIKSRRLDALMSLAAILERRAWMAPEDADDDLNPLGLPYWVPKLDEASYGAGFYGGSAIDGVNSVGNIEPATADHNKPAISGGNERWRSFQAGGHDGTDEYYLEINDAAVRTMRLIFYKINFVSPFLVRDLVQGFKSNYRIYCNTITKIDLEELVEKRNDSLGNDLSPFNGITTFKRVPILHVPSLDSDSTNPIYFINHNHFRPYVQEGDYLREDQVPRSAEYPNVFVTFVNLSYNFICTNRREQAVMSVTADNS